MIRLDKEKGINPKMTVCPCCNESQDILLVGNKTHMASCSGCSSDIVGVGKNQKRCPNCKKLSLSDHQEIPDKLPGNTCESCNDAVRIGGAFFQCTCGSHGLIRKSEFTTQFRKANGISIGELVGISFDKDCPACKDVV